MRAVTYHGKHDVRVEDVPDPILLNPRDAIVKVTSTTICGSDLHLYGGFIAGMVPGDIIGHECMGEVVEVGRGVRNVRVGDRVVVSCVIACGRCFYCSRGQVSCCDNSNPQPLAITEMYGDATAALFGYSQMFGGYAGAQAEYLRVPYADVGLIRVPGNVPDDTLLFLSDIFPTGYMAAENCAVEPGDVVAVWGCGPVGQFAIRSLFLQGAQRVIAMDLVPERLEMARAAGAETINIEDVDDVADELRSRTAGFGPDACLDAVGMEAHGTGLMGAIDAVKQKLRLEMDRPRVLREMITACRKGGRVSVVGVYAGPVDKLPFGSAFNKGLTFRMGQVNLQRYAPQLLDRILRGDIDPSFCVTHHMSLDDAPQAYKMFLDKQAMKIMLHPAGLRTGDAHSARAGEDLPAERRPSSLPDRMREVVPG